MTSDNMKGIKHEKGILEHSSTESCCSTASETLMDIEIGRTDGINQVC